MNPRLRRLLLTLLILAAAGGIVLVSVIGPGRRGAPAPAAPVQPAAASPAPPNGAAPGDAAATAAPPPGAAVSAPPPAPAPVEGLQAEWVRQEAAQPLGSLDPATDTLYVEFSPAGAGVARITLPRFWLTAADGRQAAAHYAAIARGQPAPPLPPDAQRYLLQAEHLVPGVDPKRGAVQVALPVLAADTLEINGKPVSLLKQYTDDAGAAWVLWKQTAPGAFEALIKDGAGQPVARVTRQFTLAASYDLMLAQRVENLSTGPLQLRWIQHGPGDLIDERGGYLESRRFRFGYLPDAANYPELVAAGTGDLLIDRRSATKRAQNGYAATDAQRRLDLLQLWPNATTRSATPQYELAWFASTNRYFALAVHSPVEAPSKSLVLSAVAEIRLPAVPPTDPNPQLTSTKLLSPTLAVAPGETAAFDMGVYAGPLDRRILGAEEPMEALRMQGLILYQMSSMCAFCTFQWLAVVLLKFLSIVHAVVADWGLAIVLLVIVVRAILHPLTRKAQVNMQRFSKVMSDLKPEIDRLQQKFPGDPKKLQQEQLRLMRERGVNPLQMMGCLPMFLQMPIWIALYAMLYFAFELRHQPAFWGFFQLFWGWPFLGDLSSADHCFWTFNQPFRLLGLINMTGINLLPFLMAAVFLVQQKYLSPPPSPTMTKEQIQQQKMMKIMMVVLFPLMLYSAPSGLTLYMVTSSLIGIVEGHYIRQHIKEMDLAPPKPKDPKKPKDLMGRLYTEALERAKKKRLPPPKKYKSR